MSVKDFHKRIAKSVHRDRSGDTAGWILGSVIISGLIFSAIAAIIVGSTFDSVLYGIGTGVVGVLTLVYCVFMLQAYYEGLKEELEKDGKL